MNRRKCKKQIAPGTLSAGTWYLLALLLLPVTLLQASEVIQEVPTQVVVRKNPKSGKPYVVVTKPENAAKDPFESIRKKTSRPDYRMLDPKMKSGQIPYDGPVSDRTKVYVLAATLAAAGTVSGVAVIAAAPAATGAGATGGAGLLAGSGAGVAAGTFGIAEWAKRPDPKQDDFTHTSQSKREQV